MNRPTRRMDSKGLRILRANEYRILKEAGCRTHSDAVSPSPSVCGEAAPPTLIGGIKLQNIGKMDAGDRKKSIGMDWVQGTIPFEKMDLVFSYLTSMCGSNPEVYNHGFLGYQAAAEWHPYGIKLMWDLDMGNRMRHGNRILLQIGGTGLGCFPAPSLHQFCRDLCVKFSFKCSRTDLCFDDYEKIIRPQEVTEFANQGSYKGFRKHKPIIERQRSGELLGDSIYFGTRGKNGAGKYLRCYGKDLESDGEVDAVRWEVEFSKERANAVFFELAMSADVTEFASKLAMFIGGAIDFIEYNGKRCDPIDRLAFWEQILDALGAAEIRCPQPEQSIETAMEWVEVSVAPSLEKIRRAIGDDRYYEWLKKQMESVELRKKAIEQIATYHRIHVIPEPATPF